MRSLLSTGCAAEAILDVHLASEAWVQCSGQFRGSRQGGGKGPSKIRESDRGQESKGIRNVKGVERRKIKEDRGASLFPHQIVDFALAHFAPLYFPTCIFRLHTRTYTACILVAPTHPLHHTVALDSRSEAMYVRRQGRGLGI